MTLMPALEVENLSTHIQLSHSVVQAVGNVSLAIDPGETLGLVGESGCGKSMLGLSVMRLLPNGGHIVGGSIKLAGTDLVKLSEQQMRDVRGNDVAMIFQDSLTSLNPTMSIGDQIAEPVRRHRKVSKAEARERAAELLGIVGFPRPRDRVGDYPHQFSGGQRQRVMIAIALSCEPDVLLADEPTTALDVTIQAQILGLLDDLKERLGMAVLLVTHDMGVVAGRADRVNVMYAGRIVESARTDELFAHMHHPYSQALLGSIPLLTQDPAEKLFSIPGIPPDLTNPPTGCRFAARCSYATERCREEEPTLAGEWDHQFACWNPIDGPINRTAVAVTAAGITVITPEAVTGTAGAAGATGAAGLTPTASDLAGSSESAVADVLAPVADVLAVAPEPEVVVGVKSTKETNGSEPDLLVIEDVVREFPVTAGAILRRKVASVKAVSGVSFSVGRGRTFGLVGESGCGKTTLGKIIVALERPDSGKTTLHGVDWTNLQSRELRHFRKDLQMMFQDPIASLDPRMRVGAILREPMTIQNVGSHREQDKIIQDLLAEVGLPATAVERFPHEFSGGQRQRIGLARALTLNPQVIVADEPVSALDVSIRSQVLNLMKRLQALHGLTFVVISHDLAVVKYLADRIGVMYLGKMVELGDPDDIYHRPAHHYTAGLIATIPEPDPAISRAKRGVVIKGELPSPVNPPSGCRFRTRCPAAQEICAEEEPMLRPFGPGHEAACHFPLQEPMKEAQGVPVAISSTGQ
jgi:peptide/nickel transport system ATP-binding protein